MALCPVSVNSSKQIDHGDNNMRSPHQPIKNGVLIFFLDTTS